MSSVYYDMYQSLVRFDVYKQNGRSLIWASSKGER